MFKKLKAIWGKTKDKMVYAAMPLAGSGFALADGDQASSIDSFLTEIKGALSDFTTTNLAKILVAALGITAVLAIAWFGYRFIVRKTSGAMKKGKL